jgi:CheY-like chemotaxis protein
MTMRALRLLLVEDDPIDRRLFEELLRETGLPSYELQSAERVASAVRQLQGLHFDLILTDLSLPDAYGRDTVAQLRAAAPQVPIVVLTGSEYPDLDTSFAGLNVDHYVAKHELTPDVLTRLLQGLVNGSASYESHSA